jgi:uncharacterized protein YkwD
MRTARPSFVLPGAVALLLAAGGCSGTPNFGPNDPDAAPGAKGDGGGSSTPPGADSGTPDATTGDDSSSPDTDGGPSAFDPFQEYNLQLVNMYRATLHVAPLTLDSSLCVFALAGSVELSMDHTPHEHFLTAESNGTLWMTAGGPFRTEAAENQGNPAGWPVLDASNPTMNEMDQIAQIQQAMFDEGPGSGEAHGHYTNMMNADYTRLGVGLLEVDSSLYLTNDFSN